MGLAGDEDLMETVFHKIAGRALLGGHPAGRSSHASALCGCGQSVWVASGVYTRCVCGLGSRDQGSIAGGVP